MNGPARLIATFFGSGSFPVAPGTFASLITVLLYRFALDRLGLLPYLSIVAGLFFLGVWAAGIHARDLGRKDPRAIVIDEVAGQLIALAACPASWVWLLAGFFLFRAFDIIKPPPIRLLENLPGGWGIMADDALAGVFTAILIQVGWRIL